MRRHIPITPSKAAVHLLGAMLFGALSMSCTANFDPDCAPDDLDCELNEEDGSDIGTVESAIGNCTLPYVDIRYGPRGGDSVGPWIGYARNLSNVSWTYNNSNPSCSDWKQQKSVVKKWSAVPWGSTIQCTNSWFGCDPDFGHVKSCYQWGAASSWKRRVAGEGETFTLPPGHYTKRFYPPSNNSCVSPRIDCNNATFGDPAAYYVKWCETNAHLPPNSRQRINEDDWRGFKINFNTGKISYAY